MTASSTSSASDARYAVIGNPIAHSKSPNIHAAFAAGLGQQIHYDRRLCPLGDFAADLERFRNEGGVGANVTVPFKRDAFAIAREASLRAQQAGAANFLAWRGDHWYCDNTDGAGLVRDIEGNLGFSLKGKRVLLLGAGGAARGVIGPLLLREPTAIVVVNRTQANADAIVAPYLATHPVSALPASDLLAQGQRFDCVINATSASLAGALPLPDGAAVFAPGALAYDMMYGKVPTIFMAWAAQHGAARIADGLGMLVEQAAESYVQWRGVQPVTAPIIARMRAELAAS
ncbi:MAG: shikimate dehydrogenase [Burkholderiales bacterium]|nr:shikimate dehydrogenase [Burkholderiales bacterium]